VILNQQQRIVVDHKTGPLLVLACPGSGKTRCITERIIRLINKGENPQNILAVTFTNKASREMLKRISKRGYDRNLLICTFHSLCVRILRRCCHLIGWKRNFSICDGSAQKSLIRKITKELGYDPQEKTFDPKRIIKIIEDKKNQLLSDEKFELHLQEEYVEIIREYHKTLKLSNSYDFGDLIYHTVELFKKEPKVQQAYAIRFKHILVDETQDTNKAQFELIKRLSSYHNNIVAVADELQSIYGWRGACIDNILRFGDHFSDTKIHTLSINYRSTSEILYVAEKLINRNKNQRKVALQSIKGSGEQVQFLEHDTPEEESEEIANLVNQLKWDGHSLKEMAILCRVNSLTRTFEECFRRRDIPYVLIGSFGFYDRKEVKTGIAFMKFLANREDAISFENIVNVPSRGVGPKTIVRILEYAIDNKLPFLEVCKNPQVKGIRSKTKEALIYFANIIDSYSPAKPCESLSEIFEEVGFLDHLRETDRTRHENREDNILELLRGFQAYCTRKANPTIEQYVQEIMLLSSTDNESKDDAINLMTVHAAKGLEFDVVFVPGMEEGIFPHERSIEEGNVSEERRVCYVACTRARDRLYLSRSKMRATKGSPIGSMPSRFLDDMGLISIDWNN